MADEAKPDLLRDDAACRDAFRQGERWAMEQVYTSYLPLVRMICRQGFGGFRGFFDPVDRDDAVQTIFTSAFEERTRLAYDGLHPYSSFLRGIAHNTVRRMLDSKRRFDRRPETAPVEDEDLETLYMDAEICALLRQFRESVTDRREAAVLQRYFCDGLAEEKLAAELGITRYRTRKIIARLHKRMTRFLASHGIDGT